MKKIIYFLFLVPIVASAQKITIKGILRDTTNAPLPSATILLLNPNDSSLVNFGASNPDGAFEMKNLNRQEYLFKVTYVGYQPFIQKIMPSQSESVVDLGVVKMKIETRELSEVLIQAEKSPVTIKQDTIEFNAASFKTKENAVVEDLLKKLPGVEVDNDGTIRAQGEQVRRVTVDGKNFFGNDPKLATRNLPADAINKVQVFDRKSDQAAFSGIDDGQREKTINLELKEEKRNGAFGNVMAGAGSDERYQARASLNKFQKGQQLSFLGMANNVNEQGFGIDEYMNFTGGAQQMMSGRGNVRIEFNGNNQNGVPLNFGGRNNGLMNNYATGLNFNKDFSKKTELNSSYFYNHLDHNLIQSLERINTLPSGDLRFNQNSRQSNRNDNHRLNAVLDHKIDSLNSLRWTTNLTYNETHVSQRSTSGSIGTDGNALNENIRNTTSSGNSVNLNTNLLWRHRFGKKGRTLSANVQLVASNSEREGTLDALTEFYTPQARSEHLLQTNSQTNENLTYGTSFSYTEPLGNRKYLEVNYNFRQNRNDVKQEVYDLESDVPEFNETLSNAYVSDYQYHRGGLNFRLNRSKYNLTVGGSVQQTYLHGDLKTLDAQISKSYQNFLPVARLSYNFSNSKRFNADYETSVAEPSIQQLQPVVNNADPLNIYVGNPELRPGYAHSWRFNFTTFNPVSSISFFAFVDATYTENAITTAQNFTSEGVRISRAINVDNNLRLNGNASFGFPIQKLKSRFSISANATRLNTISMLDDVANDVSQTGVGGRLRYDFRYKEIFDVSLSANASRQATDYEFNQQANQLYFNNTFNAESNFKFLKHYQFSPTFEYLVYKNKTNQFEQTIPLLNLSVSRYMLKARSGELKFGVNNVLDKNLGVSQTAELNYFERQVSNSLGRYYMLSFTYALNKQLNPMGGAGSRGGMIRMMR